MRTLLGRHRRLSTTRSVFSQVASSTGSGDIPSLDLDFSQGILDSRIDFQRTTVGTYYRGQFNQNLLQQSAAVRTSPWATGGLTTAGASITAPDGTANGVEFVAANGTTIGNAYSFQQVTATAATAYTASVFLKAKGTALNTIVRMQARASTTALSNLDVTFNNANGTVGSVTSGTWTATSATSTPIGNGWYRVTLTGTTPATTNNLWAAFFFDATGNGTDGVYAWGAQLTEGSLLTPYIPTTTAAITQGQIASSQPWNLFPRSQEFDVSPWASAVTGAGVSPVITANAAVAPDGTTTADQIDFNCGGLTLSDRCIRRQATSLSATTYTVSVWARSATGTTQHIQFHQDSGTSATTFAIGTSWQRITLTYTSVGGSVQTGLELRGNNTAGVTTSSIYVWGMQLNEGSSALDYRSTTSSALWLPRFENDPVTGEARGLLIESGATNLLQQSAAVRTSPWYLTNFTAAGTSITAPDGTANGVELVVPNGTAPVGATNVQIIDGSASTAYTMSVFLKPKGTAVNTQLRVRARNSVNAVLSDMFVDFDHATGTVGAITSGTWTSISSTSTNVGNGWYRVTLTGTSPATTANIVVFLANASTGNGTDGVYAWGAQIEAQAFASSYIPTTTATVARGADSAVMTGTNFSSWYNQSEGTLFTELRVNNLIGTRQGANINSPIGGANLNFVATGTSASDVFVATRIAGTVYADFLATTSLGPHKLASAYTQSVQAGAANGTAFADTSTPAFVVTLNQMHIGDNPVATAPLNGHIRRIAYWPTRLPNATLQSLTT